MKHNKLRHGIKKCCSQLLMPAVTSWNFNASDCTKNPFTAIRKIPREFLTEVLENNCHIV